MSRWFRHYAGMMRDEKLVRVALRAKQPIERVLWVWGAILESAAEINDGGRYELDHAECAYFLRVDEGDISVIEDALSGLGRIADSSVANWGERQFQTEKSGAATTTTGKVYVYVVGTTWSDVVKVGISKNPWARVIEFQTGSQTKLLVLATFRCAEHIHSEIDIHDLLKPHHSHGEWFKLPESIAKKIQEAGLAKVTYEALVAELRSSTTEELRSPTTSVSSSFLLPLLDDSLEDSRGSGMRVRECTPRAKPPDDWPPNYRDVFWAKYPNKVGKRKVLEKLDAVRKRGVSWNDLWGGLCRYCDKTDDRPWCNPETWLNQDRWTDEPAVVEKRNGTGGSVVDVCDRLIADLESRDDSPPGEDPFRRLSAG